MNVNFLNLPKSTINFTLSFLTPKELCLVAQVCKKLKEIASEDFFWQKPLNERKLTYLPGYAKTIFLGVCNKYNDFESLKGHLNFTIKALAKEKNERSVVQLKKNLVICLAYIKEKSLFSGKWDELIAELDALHGEEILTDEIIYFALSCLRPSITRVKIFFTVGVNQKIALENLKYCVDELPYVLKNFKAELKQNALQHQYSNEIFQAIEQKQFQVISSSFSLHQLVKNLFSRKNMRI